MDLLGGGLCSTPNATLHPCCPNITLEPRYPKCYPEPCCKRCPRAKPRRGNDGDGSDGGGSRKVLHVGGRRGTRGGDDATTTTAVMMTTAATSLCCGWARRSRWSCGMWCKGAQEFPRRGAGHVPGDLPRSQDRHQRAGDAGRRCAGAGTQVAKGSFVEVWEEAVFVGRRPELLRSGAAPLHAAVPTRFWNQVPRACFWCPGAPFFHAFHAFHVVRSSLLNPAPRARFWCPGAPFFHAFHVVRSSRLNPAPRGWLFGPSQHPPGNPGKRGNGGSDLPGKEAGVRGPMVFFVGLSWMQQREAIRRDAGARPRISAQGSQILPLARTAS